MMSAPLSKELRDKYKVRSLPIRKDDEVQLNHGKHKSSPVTGKITAVYRKKWVVHVDRAQREKANGLTVPIPVHPSRVVITKLKLNKNRKELLERRAAGRRENEQKGKYTEDVEMESTA